MVFAWKTCNSKNGERNSLMFCLVFLLSKAFPQKIGGTATVLELFKTHRMPHVFALSRIGFV